jgi:hypothetical protein
MNQSMLAKFRLTALSLTSALAISVAGRSWAQSAIQINGVDVNADADEAGDASAPYTIFSNLGSNDDRYNTIDYDAEPVVGRKVNGMTEQWDAVRFVPKVDVQATVLEAAVGYISGNRAVTLSLYDSTGLFGNPGSVLPGAQGTTTKVPDLGECCQLAAVTLPQPVTLTGGTIYWLVASPGSLNFNGAWQVSHLGEAGLLAPGIQPWVLSPSEWPAARIRGTPLPALRPLNRATRNDFVFERDAAKGKVNIFSNLTHIFSPPYTTGVGSPITGNDVQFHIEEWWALPFTPRVNVQAKSLTAAIARISGTSKINLTLYSDSDGLPGAPLPGGQGSTTDIPDSGQCCDYATVRLPNVSLSAGVQYWLVASPSSDAEDFMGIWQISTNNIWAVLNPEQSQLWTDFNGDWMAAQIFGLNE